MIPTVSSARHRILASVSEKILWALKYILIFKLSVHIVGVQVSKEARRGC